MLVETRDSCVHLSLALLGPRDLGVPNTLLADRLLPSETSFSASFPDRTFALTHLMSKAIPVNWESWSQIQFGRRSATTGQSWNWAAVRKKSKYQRQANTVPPKNWVQAVQDWDQQGLMQKRQVYIANMCVIGTLEDIPKLSRDPQPYSCRLASRSLVWQ